MLRRERWMVNHKRVYRLYRLEDLSVRTKKRKKRASHLRVVAAAPVQANERWSMDFVQDALDDGRRFRALTPVDVFTRECLMIAPTARSRGTRLRRCSTCRRRP